MSRISQDTARHIAVKMTEKHREKVISIRKEISTIMVETYKAQIPAQVLAFHDKNPGWIEKTNSLKPDQAIAGEWNFTIYEWVLKARGGAIVKLTKAQRDKIEKLSQKIRDGEKEIATLKREIQTALLNLGSIKQIKEQFPEAIPFLLGDKVNTSLIVNLSDIRKKL